MTLPWDGTERVGAGLYVLVSAGLAWLTLASTGGEWRYEMARATDAAGLYLFFACPLLMALCALSAQRLASLVRELAPVLPQPFLGARAAWIRYAGLACAIHVVVLGAVLVVAWRSDAVLVLSYQPFLRQFLQLVAFAAAGALIGPVARSVALPGAVMVLALVVAVLLPFTGLRPFMLAGAASFDFSFERYSRTLMLLDVLVAAAMLLPTVPWQRAWRGAASVRMVVSNVCLAAAVVLMVSGSAYQLVAADAQQACQVQRPTICGPRSLEGAIMRAADASQSVRSALPRAARRVLPTRLTLVSASTQVRRRGAVDFDTAMMGRPGAVERSVIATMSGEHACSPERAPQQVLNHVLASATVAGWLQRKLGTGLAGSYPSDLVTRLESYPVAEQDQLVGAMLEHIWACRPVDLSRLR